MVLRTWRTFALGVALFVARLLQRLGQISQCGDGLPEQFLYAVDVVGGSIERGCFFRFHGRIVTVTVSAVGS